MKQEEKIGKKRKYFKDHLIWVDGKGWRGIVYSYKLFAPNDEKDGWRYIGCTPEEGTRRRIWLKPKNKYAGEKIADARKKYTINAFAYDILETHYDPDIDKLVEKLEERESYYIEKYDTVEHGFNGNYGGTGRKGQKISDDEIARRNKAREGFHHTEETKQHISESQIGRKQSDEAKAKISAGNSGKKRTEAMNKKQSERMKGKEPVAATEGAKEWVKKNGGGYWKGKQMPEDARAKLKLIQQANGTAVRAICVKDGTTEDFTTMLDASKKTGDGAGSIKYSIENGNTTKRGYKYKKIDKNEIPRIEGENS